MPLQDNPSIRQEAARWFQLRTADEPAPDDQARFETWLAANPAHAAEYRALEKIWERLDELPLEAPRKAAAARGRRGFALRFAASSAFVLVAAVSSILIYRWHIEQPLFTAQYSARPGERARIDLPDGTKLELNADSRMRVTFYRDRRDSVLETGEAALTVAHDANHPFTVMAGHASVRVVGTRFSVRLIDATTLVALEEGAIEVSSPGAVTAKLAAPAAARVAEGGIEQLAAADVQRLTAWRQGQIVFRDDTLATAARELSRYRKAPVLVADAEVAALKVTGIAFVENPDAFIEGLPNVLPVAAERRADGAVVIHGTRPQ